MDADTFAQVNLQVIVLNGGSRSRLSFRPWATVDLGDRANLVPFIAIWMSLLATFIVVIVKIKRHH